MDTARRHLAGLAQLPAHGGKQATKKQDDGAMPQRIAAPRLGMDGWLLALRQFGNVIHRVIGTRGIPASHDNPPFLDPSRNRQASVAFRINAILMNPRPSQ